MLNEKQLEALPERISLRLRQVNELALEKIGKHIKEIGEMKPSDVHKIKQLMTYGSGYDEIVSKLTEVSKKNEQDIYDIFDVIANDNSSQAEELAKAKNKSYLPYEQNKQLKQFVNAMAKQTAEAYRNMANTIAFMRRDENGKRVLTSLSKTYQDITDKAVTAVATGVEDYQSAMRQVIKDLADSGLRTKYQPLNGSAGKTVDYASGYSRRLDTAVRQNILWGVKECNQNISDMLGEELGADGYEISYHSNPRPTHEEMGGRQYAIGNGRKINGKYYPPFSSVEGLLSDYGCLHFKFPVILGVSVSAYSDKELKAMKEQSKQKVMFEGKEYTMYECKQMQRQLETAARHAKDRQIIAKASGDDVLRRLEQERINAITHKYKQLSDASGLPTKMERMSVSKYHRVKTNSVVDKRGKSGIMKLRGEDNMTIASIKKPIELPIEQKHTGKGNPNAVLTFGVELNNRQKLLLKQLTDYDSRITVAKSGVNMADLSALTAYTGDEYAMFTKGKERIIIRGNSHSVNVDIEAAKKLAENGYKWSGHTHPGTDMICMFPSDGDKAVLGQFKHNTSVIYNSKGQFATFEKE